MKKWPKCTWSYSCNLLHPSQHLWPLGEFSITSWLRKWKLRLVLQVVPHDRHAPSESGYLCETLMESGEEKSFKWVELQSVHLVVHFSWKDKWSKRIYTDSLPKPMVFTAWSGSWNEHDWKLWQESLGRRCVERPLWKVRWCKNIWVSCEFSLRGDLLTWKF